MKSSEILEKVINKDEIKRYTICAIAQFICAVNYNLFVLPSSLLLGGTSGLATIICKPLNLDPSIVLFVLYFLLFLVCIVYLGKEDITVAGFTMIVYPLFVKATTGINEIFLINHDNILLIALFAGILNGIYNGMIYKTGLNTGGMGIIAKIIAQKNKKSVSLINLIINVVIVLIGCYFFGINIALYSCLLLYISNYISEKILLGTSRNKTFYIISKKADKINEFITETLKHDATIFNVKGQYKDQNYKMIFTVIPNEQYYILKEGVKSIDEKCFITVSDTYEIEQQDILINKPKKKKTKKITKQSKKMI